MVLFNKYLLSRIFLFYLIFSFNSFTVKSQERDQYFIDISKDKYSLYSSHLNMGSNVSPSGDSLSYTNMYLTKNGRPWLPVMGEMHYSRIPKADWEESILKMKSAGIQIIATYVFWIQAEEEEGKFNWSGNNDLRKFTALCSKHGLYVWLRIGPWCHGEMRNGGFPDWLLKKGIGLRKNDPGYLMYVKRLYTEIGRQVKGYYYKQGGNIIGIQLENELAYKDKERYEHMLTLKAMAIEAGMDVPYYSAFAPGPADQKDFLTPIGAYPDSPWSQNTKKLVKSVFFFNPLENDREIGADLFGQIDTRVYGKYPPLSAELGGGMQVTYHRRTKVSWEDVLSIAYTRLGSGLNGLGYYMFHGGINPPGKFSTLQESRATGYPNDVPVINYDFQAPVGSMNDLKPSYYEYKLLHAFVNDFGEELAAMPAFFPKQRVKSPYSYDTVRVAVRSRNNSGYLFLSNYQRYSDLKEVSNFQLSIRYKDELLKVPERPVSFPANAMMIWPLNQTINGSKLIYGTAQPMHKLTGKQKDTYVFYAPEDAEFVFDDATVNNISGDSNIFKISIRNGKRYVTVKQPGEKAVLSIEPKNGKKYDILILNKEAALHSWKYNVNETDYLIVTDADLFVNKDHIVIQKYNQPSVELSVYPDLKLNISDHWTIKTDKTDNGFAHYTFLTVAWSQQAMYQEEKDQQPDYLNLDEDALKKIKITYPEPLMNAVKIGGSNTIRKTFFRKNFSVTSSGNHPVYFAFSPDDYAKVYCNGALLEAFTSNNLLSVYNLTNYIKNGSNNLSVEITNNHAESGFQGNIFILNENQINAIATDASWKMSKKLDQRWYEPAYNDTNWQKAVAAKIPKKQLEWDNPQPGNLYDQVQRYYPGQKQYHLQLPQKVPPFIKDVYMDISYSGDMAAIYQDKKLIYDDFNYGSTLKLRLNSLKLNDKDKLDIQLFPAKETSDVFVEDEFKSSYRNGQQPQIHSITFLPLYQAVITVRHK